VVDAGNGAGGFFATEVGTGAAYFGGIGVRRTREGKTNRKGEWCRRLLCNGGIGAACFGGIGVRKQEMEKHTQKGGMVQGQLVLEGWD